MIFNSFSLSGKINTSLDIINLLSEDKENLSERFRTLYIIYEDIIENLYKKKTYIQDSLLFHVASNYWVEKMSYKELHGIKILSDCKKASFIMKWLMRFRPVQIKENIPSEEIDECLLLVNEVFAVYVGLIFSKINISKIDENMVDTIQEMLFNFRYREINSKTLWLTLDVLFKYQAEKAKNSTK